MFLNFITNCFPIFSDLFLYVLQQSIFRHPANPYQPMLFGLFDNILLRIGLGQRSNNVGLRSDQLNQLIFPYLGVLSEVLHFDNTSQVFDVFNN